MAAHGTTHTGPTASGWTYGSCPLETAPDRFGPFSDLVRTWQARRPADGGLPARSAFAFEDVTAWMGRIFIAKIETDPFDLRFTLWGTMLSDWWGVDYTGKTLGAQSIKPDTWALERRYFEAMWRAPFIGLAGGYLTQHGRDYIKILGLDLPLSNGPLSDGPLSDGPLSDGPLSDGRGTGMTQVLSAHLRVEMKDGFDTLLPDCPRTLFKDDR